MTIKIGKFEFNNNVLFNDTGFTLQPTDKISLTGNNGVGKSTLLNILCGKISYDVSIKRSFKFIYFGADTSLPPDLTMSRVVWQFSDLLDRELQIKLISRFNFENHMHTKIGALSHGNRVKSKLIFLFSLKKSGLLLLDEPTENLDNDSILFLAQHLNARNNGHIIVSHNHAFLKDTCSRHLSIFNTKIVDDDL